MSKITLKSEAVGSGIDQQPFNEAFLSSADDRGPHGHMTSRLVRLSPLPLLPPKMEEKKEDET